jgi:hypothetical protein
MSRRVFTALAVLASLMSGTLGRPAPARGAGTSPDLTGLWRLDPARSDTPQRMGSAPGGAPNGEPGGYGRRGSDGGGMGPGGRRGGPGRMGRVGRGARPQGEDGGPVRGARPVRLPDLMHITQTETVVSFEDSTGTVLQEITTMGTAKDTLLHSPGAAVIAGAWSDTALVVERQGPRGGKVTQSYALQDRGATLVIETRMESPDGAMPAREFKRVYRKAES